MKFLLTTVLLLTSTVTAQANKQICAGVSGAASLIMELRQSNAPLSSVLEIAGDVAILEELVIEAYKKPRYSSKAYQNSTIADFSNLAFLTCIQEYNK